MLEAVLQLVIWLGSGFAFAIGIVIGFALAKWATDKTQKMQAVANELLEERNRIGQSMAEGVLRVASTLEQYKREQDNLNRR